MIDTAIVTLLKDQAEVVNVRAGGEDVKVTAAILPIAFYTQTSGRRDYTDDGPTGLIPGQFQLDIFAAQPTAARAIADAIRIALDGYSGEVDDTKIERIHFPDSGRHAQPTRLSGDGVSVARFIVEMVVTYRESTNG